MGLMKKYNKFSYKFSQLNILEKIISINIILFVIPLIIYTICFLFKIPNPNIYFYLELFPNIDNLLFRPWSLFTYGFIHASIGHLFWNMIMLYFFSTLFLNLFKEDELIFLYFLGIIVGGLFFVFSYSLFPVFTGVKTPLVGSSAGVISVVIYMCTYSPNTYARIFFFNVKLIYLGIALIIFDLVQLPVSNSGGHIAHLGGVLIGFFAAYKMKSGDNIFNYFKKFKLGSSKNVQIKTFVHSNSKGKNQKEIDRILDKINESGYDSLTNDEKKALNEASEN